MILITGSSGFIGSFILSYLRIKKIKSFGIDKNNNKYLNFKNFEKVNLLNKKKLNKILKKIKPKYIIHLAAEVRFK
jgi:GDP-4-dehydro-6-deoxy-D-mannose reductase